MLGVLGRMRVMPVRQVGVVGGLLVIALGMRCRGCVVVARSVLVVLRCLRVMFRCFLRHSKTSIRLQKRASLAHGGLSGVLAGAKITEERIQHENPCILSV